mmetsp:Transcript_22114/g.46044  ORF Transcript_22114/g.46044 Transcript_22114/m.46044 type:complete len:108 (+) Transcript_22114:2525-2848(+)
MIGFRGVGRDNCTVEKLTHVPSWMGRHGNDGMVQNRKDYLTNHNDIGQRNGERNGQRNARHNGSCRLRLPITPENLFLESGNRMTIISVQLLISNFFDRVNTIPGMR